MVTRLVWRPASTSRALRRELELPDAVPARGAARGRRGRRVALRRPGPARPTAPTSRSSPSTRPTSRDLDQAMRLQPRSAAATGSATPSPTSPRFVRAGGALEAETWRRGETVYLPDGKVPLHPVSLSRGRGQPAARPDPAGRAVDDRPRRRRRHRRGRGSSGRIVRSRAKLDYAGVQADADAGQLAEPIALLPEIGALLHRARPRPRRHQPAHPRAGSRARRRRLAARAARAAAGRGVERADLTADRHGGRGHHARAAASVCCARCRRRGRRRSRRCATAAAGLGIDWPDGATRRPRARQRRRLPPRAAPRSSTRRPS